MSIVGIRVSLPTAKREKPPKEKVKPTGERLLAKKRRRRKQARLVWNCLLDDDIRGSLMRRFAHLPVDLWNAVEVSRFRCNVSLPDPALNGMLWGALAAVDGGLGRRLECNFLGRNEVQTEVRLYPHRAVKAFLTFFLCLPYRAIFKQWRTS